MAVVILDQKSLIWLQSKYRNEMLEAFFLFACLFSVEAFRNLGQSLSDFVHIDLSAKRIFGMMHRFLKPFLREFLILAVLLLPNQRAK